MALIPFPNVPNVPGVPALPRSAGAKPAVQVALGLIQGALWRAFQVDIRWGVFDSTGKPLTDLRNFQGRLGSAIGVLGDGGMLGMSTVSTGGVEYSKETRVSDFPLERGGFASHNKVELPANPTVTLNMSGSESDRTKFLDAIDKATKSTDLYSVATPEVTYVGYTIERYNYQRRANRGATLLIVELSLKEVRQVSASYAKSAVVNPKNSGATPQVDAGKVQAKAPDVSTLKGLSNKFPTFINKLSTMLGG